MPESKCSQKRNKQIKYPCAFYFVILELPDIIVWDNHINETAYRCSNVFNIQTEITSLLRETTISIIINK